MPVRAICTILEAVYGNPSLGNQDDPLDELIFIILSTRTHERSYRPTFARLKELFPIWEHLTAEALAELERLLAPGGFGRLKARQIVAILDRLRARFGWATLAPLEAMDDGAAEAFLTSLPGVAAKVAKCVLMYSLKRDVLPVDVHVHRVATRLGFRTKKRPDTSQDLIEAAVPPELRYGFHVNCVAHGRAVCVSGKPRCDLCPLTQWCRYYLEATGDSDAGDGVKADG